MREWNDDIDNVTMTSVGNTSLLSLYRSLMEFDLFQWIEPV